MENFSKLDENTRDWCVDRINQRWGQLHGLQKDWAEKAIRYLLLTNSGGAIATLSFLGASGNTLNTSGAKVAMFLFVAGVILVGVIIAKTFHFVKSLFDAWRQNVNHYLNDRITWDHLHEEDNSRANLKFWDYAFPYASFVCFICGCVVGGISLFL